MYQTPAKVSVPLEYHPLLNLAEKVLAKHRVTEGKTNVFPAPIMDSLAETLDQVYATNDKIALIETKIKTNEDRYMATLGLSESQNPDADSVYRVVADIRKAVLDIYDQNENSLTQYGYRVKVLEDGTGITIPNTPKGLNQLTLQILKRANLEGEYCEIPAELVERLRKTTGTAEAILEKGKQLQQAHKAALQYRDSLVGIVRGQHHKTPNTLRFYLISARDILMRMYRENPQELLNLGFTLK